MSVMLVLQGRLSCSDSVGVYPCWGVLIGDLSYPAYPIWFGFGRLEKGSMLLLLSQSLNCSYIPWFLTSALPAYFCFSSRPKPLSVSKLHSEMDAPKQMIWGGFWSAAMVQLLVLPCRCQLGWNI